MRKLLLSITCFLVLFSCKKEESASNSNGQTCYLSSQVLNDSIVTSYEWDNQGRILRSVNRNLFTGDSVILDYKYLGNRVEATNGSVYYLNENGNADSAIVQVQIGPTTLPGKLYYRYNAQVQMISRRLLIPMSFGELELLTEFSWKDGDIVAQLQTTTSPGFSRESYSVLVPHKTLLNEIANWQNKALFAGKPTIHVTEKEIRELDGSETEEINYAYVLNSDKISKRIVTVNSDTLEVTKFSWTCR